MKRITNEMFTLVESGRHYSGVFSSGLLSVVSLNYSYAMYHDTIGHSLGEATDLIWCALVQITANKIRIVMPYNQSLTPHTREVYSL